MDQDNIVITDNLDQIDGVLQKESRTIRKTSKKLYILGDPKAILKRIAGLYDIATLDCGCDLAYEYADLYDKQNNVVGLVYIRKH